jgi:long-subunit fatty acid transport protein
MRKKQYYQIQFSTLVISLILQTLLNFTINTSEAASGQYFSETTYQNPAELTLFLMPGIDPKTGESVYYHQKFMAVESNLFARNEFTGLSGPVNPFFDPNQPSFGTAISNNYIPIFSFAYTAKLSDQSVFNINIGHPLVAVGEYADDSFSRFSATKGIYQSWSIQPNIALKINDLVSVGIGTDFMQVDAQLTTDIPGIPFFGIPQTTFDNKIKDWAEGWHAGVMLHPWIGTFLGFSYFSPIEFNLTGASTLTGNGVNQTSNITGSPVTFPSTERLKLYQAFSRKWGVIGRVDHTDWSYIKEIPLNNTTLGDISIPFNYRNTWRYGLGLRYAPRGWEFISGATYNQTPTNPRDARITGPEKNYISAGGSVEKQLNKNFRVAFAYFHAFIGNNIPIDSNASDILTQGLARANANEFEITVTLLN